MLDERENLHVINISSATINSIYNLIRVNRNNIVKNMKCIQSYLIVMLRCIVQLHVDL